MNILDSQGQAIEALYSVIGGTGMEYPLYSRRHTRYYSEYFSGSVFEDVSFAVIDGGRAIAGIVAAIRTEDGRIELGAFGLPMHYIEASGLKAVRAQGARKMVCKRLGQLIEQRSPVDCFFRDFLPKGGLSAPGEYLLRRGAVARPFCTQVIDLSKPETDLWQDIRKSYKHLINRGAKIMKVQVHGKDSDTDRIMEEFRTLHLHVAGRPTRSLKTWQIQAEMIRHEEAFAVSGHMDGRLISMGLFIHSPPYCYYGVSASLREFFDKPAFHVLLWQAMLEAQRRGCHWFETGERLFPGLNPGPSDKDIGISEFKGGFGGVVKVRLNVNLHKAGEGAAQ